MSILIKEIEMPKNCIDCPFMISREGDECILQSADANESFESWEQMKAECPLIEVPTPHGRLIDADKLFKVLQEMAKNVDKDFAFYSKDVKLGIRHGLVIASQYLARFSDTVIEAEE